MRCRVRARRSCAQSRVSTRFCASTSLFRSAVRRWSCAVEAWSCLRSVAGCLFLPPPAPLLKKGLPALGSPRDGFGLLPGLFKGSDESAGEGVVGQDVGTDHLDQLTELDGLAGPELLGLVQDGLDLGVVIFRLARYIRLPSSCRGSLAAAACLRQ